MDRLKTMRQEVKKYIETADAKVVKMMHAMLEVDADNSWWDSLPAEIKTDLETAMAESEKEEVTTHAEIQKRYKKWVVK
jgi:TRAP-type C4-dicarboxylate transport system substrate-binding protein